MGKAARLRQERSRARQEESAKTTFWHGGVPGLEVGTMLLPAGGGMLGSQSSRGSVGDHLTSGLVYFTTDRSLARAYAASLVVLGRGTGTLYRVEPVEPIERDPDYLDPAPAVSFGAARARVIAVEEAQVSGMTNAEIGEAFGQYQFWPGPEHYCEPDGTVRPGPSLRAEGWTFEAFALLPKWTRRDQLWTVLSDTIIADPRSIAAAAPRITAPGNLLALGRYLTPDAIARLARTGAP